MRELTEAIVVDAARAVPLPRGAAEVEERERRCPGCSRAARRSPLQRSYGGRDLDLTPPFPAGPWPG